MSSGFDAHRADPLAHCMLETETFVAMAARVRWLAGELGVGLGLVQEGGYQPAVLAECVCALLEALAGEGEGGGLAPDRRSARAPARRISTAAGGRVRLDPFAGQELVRNGGNRSCSSCSSSFLRGRISSCAATSPQAVACRGQRTRRPCLVVARRA